MKAPSPDAGTLPEEPPRGASNDNVEVTASNQMILAPCSQDDVGDNNGKELLPPQPTAASNMANLNRRICIVTTAALPWRTGTAVNPLLRALALTRGRPPHFVTLWLPWLADAKAQQQLYGQPFASRADQEAWIRDYCRTRADGADEEVKLRIRFWEGSYHAGFGSIFPTEDICSLIPADEADVAILEEPEHLNWFRVPPSTKGSDASPTAKEATTLPTEGGSTISSWGWAHKFRFVVGILHTNYGAYMRQYGMGTALVTAPALNSLSALVVRAYCHRVIRLSDTLTSLDPALEVTSNVHGVRDEFLAAPSSDATPEDAAALAPVYFIGKIIWAKGFDSVLELQEAYRERTGCYFGMDVYGGGEDMKSVQRAFFGRRKANKTATSSDDGSSSHGVLSDSEHESGDEKSAAGIFRNPSSLREQVESSGEVAGEVVTKTDDLGPADVFADLSGKTLQSGAETAAETASAALKVVESVLEQGIGAFGLEKSSSSSKSRASKAFSLAPVRSRFKWRKTPLPARFMGVKDHIELRELLAQKIFLNMSTTEVLCTTSAEAMAMGKFVILPRHPSNEFFLKFPNCLAYADLDECVTKLQYALQNDPEPLDEETARMLSWEGATDRLYKASAVMEEEEKAREASGMQKERLKAAKFHLDSCRRSHFVSNLFSGNPIKKLSSKLSSKSDSGD